MKPKTKVALIFAFLLATTFIKLHAQTVYITETGKKYHMKNCSTAKTGKKGIELAEAKKQGYEPCKVCNPAGSDKKEEKPKSAVKEEPKEKPKKK